jgi:hypothetical protein
MYDFLSCGHFGHYIPAWYWAEVWGGRVSLSPGYWGDLVCWSGLGLLGGLLFGRWLGLGLGHWLGLGQ